MDFIRKLFFGRKKTVEQWTLENIAGKLREQIKVLESERDNLTYLLSRKMDVEVLNVPGYSSPVYVSKENNREGIVLKVYIPREYSYSVASAFVYPKEDSLLLEDLSVIRDFQNKKIGSALLKKVIEEAVTLEKVKIYGSVKICADCIETFRKFCKNAGVSVNISEENGQQSVKAEFEKNIK